MLIIHTLSLLEVLNIGQAFDLSLLFLSPFSYSSILKWCSHILLLTLGNQSERLVAIIQMGSND